MNKWVTLVYVLSRFWVSKWHPKILQWHPKFSNLDIVLPCIKVKRVEESMCSSTWLLAVAIATDGCNVIGRHNSLSQKYEAKLANMLSVHSHAHRLASASYYTAAELYNMVCETAKAFQCNYGSVLLFHRCDRLTWRCIRVQWRQKVGSCSVHAKQGSCRVRKQWEIGMRFSVHWSTCQRVKTMQCALFYCDL